MTKVTSAFKSMGKISKQCKEMQWKVHVESPRCLNRRAAVAHVAENVRTGNYPTLLAVRVHSTQTEITVGL